MDSARTRTARGGEDRSARGRIRHASEAPAGYVAIGDTVSFGVWISIVLTKTIRAIRDSVLDMFDRSTTPELVATDRPPRAARDGRRRIIAMLVVVVVCFAIIIGQVVRLQILDRDRYVAYGANQRTNTQVLAADRGNIVDRNGVALVTSRPTSSVFVDPKLIEDAPTEAALIAPILGLSVEFVQTKMTGKGRFAYLARKVDQGIVDRISALGLAGVSFVEETERYQPAGDSLRGVLGSTDVDNNGISGLEVQYGDALTGTPGSLSLEQSPTGRTIAVGDHSLTAAVKGDDLKLTIDRSIQFEAERLVADQVRATGAKGGTAIVSIPSTGEILAIANIVKDEESGAIVVGSNNAALTTQYEPGSVMKMVTIAAGIENDKIRPTTTFELPPTMKIYDATFGEAEGRGTVTWDVTNILTHSSNIGTIKIGQAVGKDELYSYQKLFGFGGSTGLDFPNEALGYVLSPSKYSGTSLPSIAIGQGISVTPMQMLFAYNVIANQGQYVAPKLVDSTIDAEGVEHPTASPTTRRVVSTQTADELNLMLRNVVHEGTGQLASINGYTVAGKTGTARKPQPGGGYTDKFGITRYQSTFLGFVPAERPALSVYVMMDEPGGDYTGGATAAPVFQKLATFALNRIGVKPAATDGANGGAPVDGSITSAPLSSAGVVEGDRVRALTTGSPEAVAASVPSTLPPVTSTTTTTIRRTTTR